VQCISIAPLNEKESCTFYIQQIGIKAMGENKTNRSNLTSQADIDKEPVDAHEASLYETLPDKKVQCHLCAHHCTIAEGRVGVCFVRENIDGKLFTSTYGNVISRHVDPVEKKPLYHFYPGSMAYSIATPGCNFRCPWCQNWEISQSPRLGEKLRGAEISVEEIVSAAQSTGCRSIAYTYTEPTIFFEYAYDIAQKARDVGLSNIFVTNGYMSKEMLSELHPYLDAANVDLKAFSDETYRRIIGARLQPILDNLKTMKAMGIWLEVTTLIVPDLNDDESELRDAARFMVQELGPDTPWHLSRFFPNYLMTDRPVTPEKILHRAMEIGLEEGLHYIYLGNIGMDGGNVTVCPNCHRDLIRRSQFGVLANHIKEKNLCPDCGYEISGVGLAHEPL
jgi:pyruvate formate lyase activating enzyme